MTYPGIVEVPGDTVRLDPWGHLERVKVRACDGRPMTWRQAWEVWSDVYPDRWAFQIFPPASSLLDEANVYHLLMLPEGTEMPAALDLGRWVP